MRINGYRDAGVIKYTICWNCDNKIITPKEGNTVVVNG